MLLYHGTNRDFDSFEIRQELANHNISSLAEGYGIYFAENKKLASSYGQTLYIVEIDEKNISDFTSLPFLKKLLRKIEQDVNIPISSIINVNDMFEGVLSGDISTIKLHKEITDLLDAEESFYSDYQDVITYEDDCILKRIETSFYENIQDVVKYYDKSFDQSVYICFRNPNAIQIKEKVNQ